MREKLYRLACDVAGVVHLALDEALGDVLAQQLAHLDGVLAVVLPHKLLIFSLGEDMYLFSEAAFDHASTFIEDEFIAEHAVL